MLIDVLAYLKLLFGFSVSALLPSSRTCFVSSTAPGCMCIIGLNRKQTIEMIISTFVIGEMGEQDLEKTFHSPWVAVSQA